MAAPKLPPRRITPSPEWLLLVAGGALLAFYYLTRADTIGVFTTARGWVPMTGRPLPAAWHFLFSGVVLGVLPVAIARVVFGLTPRELGLGAGAVRTGLRWLIVGLPLAILAGWIGSRSPEVRAVYPLDPDLRLQALPLVLHAGVQFCYFAGWEVLFRGVLLFGLRGRIGNGPANLVQTALSVVAHCGRALTETASALPAGLIFGWVDLSVGSIWYIALLHWIEGASLDVFILLRTA